MTTSAHIAPMAHLDPMLPCFGKFRDFRQSNPMSLDDFVQWVHQHGQQAYLDMFEVMPNGVARRGGYGVRFVADATTSPKLVAEMTFDNEADAGERVTLDIEALLSNLPDISVSRSEFVYPEEMGVQNTVVVFDLDVWPGLAAEVIHDCLFRLGMDSCVLPEPLHDTIDILLRRYFPDVDKERFASAAELGDFHDDFQAFQQWLRPSQAHTHIPLPHADM